ncbi:hypothetical protein YC2023_078545 [Brassica napus]
MQGNVSKHVTLVTEMSKLVEASKLMLAKELHMSVSDIDRLRLVMLYALRYEKENPVQLMQLFNKWLHGLPSTNQGNEDVSAYHETEETNPYVEEVSMSSGDCLVYALSSPEIMPKKDLFPETGHEEELSEETVLTEEELIFYEDSHGIQLGQSQETTTSLREVDSVTQNQLLPFPQDVGNALVRFSNLRSLYGCSIVSEKSEAHHVFQQMICRKRFQRRKKWLSAKSWMFKFKEGKHTKALPRFVHKLMEEWFIMPQTKLLRQENLSFAEEGSGIEVKGIFAKFIRFKNDWFRMNVMKVAEHGKQSQVSTGLWQSHRVHQQVTHKVRRVIREHQQKKIYKTWKFKYKSILLRRRLQNPHEQLEIVELQYVPYISSYIMSAADMAVVIQWFPGNKRPEHMTFYVIHYQLVYESKHVNSTLWLALQTSPATLRKPFLSQTLIFRDILLHQTCAIFCAMAHELIGLEDNKVDLRAIGSLPKDQQVVIILQYRILLVDNLAAS